MPVIINKERDYDCLHRERYRYNLAEATQQDFIRQLSQEADCKVELYDSSNLLPNAMILFKVTHMGENFIMNGALGLKYLTVTYLKCPEIDQWIQKVEAIIQNSMQ